MATATAERPTSRTHSEVPANSAKSKSVSMDDVFKETDRRLSTRKAAAEKVGVPEGKLFDLLRMLWKTKGEPFTDAELFQAVSLIARYDLDPLVREVYCNRDKSGRVMVIVGIDGWIKILHRTEGYDGHEQTIEFDENKRLFSATTTIYTTLRKHPVKYVAFWSEYAAVGGFVKDQMPSHMLRVFSLRHASRQFAPIGGNVVTEAEAMYLANHSAPNGDAFGTEPVTPRNGNGSNRSASDSLADMLESKSGAGQSAVSESATDDSDASDEPADDVSLVMGDQEEPTSYVSRINRLIAQATDMDALEEIEIAADASGNALSQGQRESIARHSGKRRQDLQASDDAAVS